MVGYTVQILPGGSWCQHHSVQASMLEWASAQLYVTGQLSNTTSLTLSLETFTPTNQTAHTCEYL